ncbi:YeeE/YedE family protein [Aneurinibacillus sp. Ricciae_BoGa-3]|uniref:YeeE/YedE family protein n=1 Tax=Aneurinibacillus sp. Ricciae_BoGa-3 TaxID=3022697 RepID=UPI00234074BD|nr:YeeE/YedE family protein [Aneurinibacillus sp. Ricciae_BoGa-3]WCK54063.1 YeeE/YedE family protein [Aneurinibacillus sp. Ricciae_BoGa-3]
MSAHANELQMVTVHTEPNHNRIYAIITAVLFVLGALYLTKVVSGTQGLLLLAGGVLGLALYHAHYGFTSSFRVFLTDRRGAGIRAQMILFFITNLVFLPFFLKGSIFGHPITASVSPVGISLLFGAFLFGIGMQMGDGCASGTLYHIGGGDARGIVTLVGFILGSVIGSANFTWWSNTPHIAPISFIKEFGAFGGLLINVVIMVIVFVVTVIAERKRHGASQPAFHKEPWSLKRLVHGPWSWMMGTVVLAIGALAVLLLSGKPWGVTFAFALWGSKVAHFAGVPVEQWGYWQTAANAKALHSNVLKDVTTVLDIGVILGAFLALALSGKKISFSLRQYPARMIIGLFIGGIMMGYGARLAFGCNIGAYFAGVASFSLHGWVWFVMAMLGSLVGIKFRGYCSFK